MKMFEVFSGTGSRDAIWQCAVEGEAEAVSIMRKLANENPGPYFVFDLEYGQIVAMLTGPSPKIETNPKSKSTAA
jgi:hypothetical protein